MGVLLNPVHIYVAARANCLRILALAEFQFSRLLKCFPNPNWSATRRDKQRFWGMKVLESATLPSAHSLRSRFLPWVHGLVRASALSAVRGIFLLAYVAQIASVAFCIHILIVKL